MLSGKSIEITHPFIAEEFDLKRNSHLNISDIFAGSNKKVWWLCPKSHSYEATVYHRTTGTNCPVCSNRKVIPGINDLATLLPEVAATWHPSRNQVQISQVTAGSNKKAWWHCHLGHEWEARIAKRSNGQGCPTCANRIVLTGFNDLETRFPLAASSWHPTKNGTLKPSQVAFGAASKFWWQCSNGHEWNSAFDRRRVGEGCAVCNGVKIEPGFNDLATRFPDAAKLWDLEKNGDLSPGFVSSSGTKKYWWKCPENHSFLAVASSVANSTATGCPVCNGKKALRGINDLATTDPHLVNEWDFAINKEMTPDSITRGSDRMAAWKCKYSHKWLATIGSRALQGVGCPVCSGNSLQSGFNDLATRYPELLSEWDFELNLNIEPELVMPGSHEKAWWVCSHKHRWQADISNRVRGRGCPVCRFSEPGVNDFASSFPELLEQWDFKRNVGLDPASISKATGRKVHWICDKGHNWKATVANRTVVGTGCPNCAITGYRAAEPGILYFLKNEELQSRKIGITNAGKSRLSKFTQRGWQTINLIQHDDGQAIYDAEQLVLNWLRVELHMPSVLTKKHMGSMGGWTETFALDGISDSEVLDKIYLEFDKAISESPEE